MKASRADRAQRRRAPAIRRRRRRARPRTRAAARGSAPCGPRRRPTDRRAGRARCSRAPSRARSACRERLAALDLRQHEAQRARQAALDLEDAVARFDQLAVGVEDRQPGADGRLGAACAGWRPRPAPTARLLGRRGPASGRLLASTTSMPGLDAPSSTSGVVSSAVRSTRIGLRERVLARTVSASAGLARRPPRVSARLLPACLPSDSSPTARAVRPPGSNTKPLVSIAAVSRSLLAPLALRRVHASSP